MGRVRTLTDLVKMIRPPSHSPVKGWLHVTFVRQYLTNFNSSETMDSTMDSDSNDEEGKTEVGLKLERNTFF